MRKKKVELKTLGSEHPEVAMSYFKIGAIRLMKGENEKVLGYFEFFLESQQKIMSEDDPYVAVSYEIICEVLHNQGEYRKALEYYEKSLELKLSTLGHVHTDVAKLYFKLGDCYENLQNLDTAIIFYQKGYVIEIKGGFPFRIASCLEQLGDKKEALNYYIQSAEIRKNDPDVGLEDESTQESIKNVKRLFKEIDSYELEKIPFWLKEFLS